MTQPKTQAHPADILAALPPLDRRVAELKALLTQPQPRGAFLELAASLPFPSPDGRPWNVTRLQDSLNRLRDQKILDRQMAIEAAWIGPLTLDLVARPDGLALIHALRQRLPKSHRETKIYHWDAPRQLLDDVNFSQSIRLAVLLNDEAEVERLAVIVEWDDAEQGSDRHAMPVLLAACPADPSFLATLRPKLRDRVAAARIDLLVDFGNLTPSVAALIAAARQEQWGEALPRFDRAMLRLDIMAERFDAAQSRIKRVRSSDPVAAATAEASLAFLAGRNAEALEQFRAALKQHRKLVGKRKVALPHEGGLFHVLALFASAEAALQPEIETMLTAIEAGNGPAIPALPVLAALLDFVAGRDGKAKAERHGSATALNPLAGAAITLAFGLIDGGLAERHGADNTAAVQRWGSELLLPMRILAEVHARFSDDTIAWTNRLIRLGPGLGRRFLDIVPIRDPWERSLDRLEGLIGAGRGEVAKVDAPARAKRLVFLVDPVTQEITPQEQTAKAGGWSGGRAVALKRLHQHDPKLDYLTPKDLTVIASIRSETGYYYGQLAYGFDPYHALQLLIGHPLVFDARTPTQRVELIRYPAELVVRETRKGVLVSLSHFSISPAVFIEQETPARWRVVEVSKALVELGGILGVGGLSVPTSGRQRIVDLIRTENPRLPIRSELAGIEGDAVQGDATPVLQIAPIEEGLSIGAVIRPSGTEGPICQPGAGARSVLVTQGGVHRRVNRDLADETVQLEAALNACPALAPWRAGDHAWRIEGFEAGLEVLQELQACPVPVKIEWPEGSPIRTTQSVGAKSVSLAISSARDWFEISGKIAVDEDLVIDMTELVSRLGQARGRFVPLADGRFVALTEDLKRRLDGFAAVTEDGKGGRRIGAAGALAVEELVNAAGKVDAAKRWRDLLARIDAAQRFEPSLPSGFEAELRDYQLDGYIWLARLCQLGLGACLADDMGLGKTVQSIALLLAEAPKGPSLVIAPTSVCHNWELESTRFAPGLRIHLLAAARDRAALVESLGPGDVLIASYGLLHHESALLTSRSWVVAIFDEAQNLKNAETRRAQASKQIEAGFRLALSGTPVENRLDELWSLFDTVAPGLLGSREAFQRRFAVPIERGRSATARHALKLLLRPFLLRRTKAAVLSELPPRTEIMIEVEP
ncbi:MAG: SNF2-related protein, partial [Aliidongia sp.]